MQQPTTLILHEHFKAGEFLNKHLPDYDYTQCECYCYMQGDKITLAWAFFNWVELPTGWSAEAAIASDGHKFTKKQFKEILALFFKNPRYNRLYALISPENKQAIRCVELMGFQLEGKLRKIAKDGDRLIYSILREEWAV